MVVVAVLVAHISGLDGLYWDIPNYDVFMHILGGLGIGFFVYALVRSFDQKWLSKTINLVLLVICAGLVWELFEIYYNIAGHPLWTKLYYIDTIKDFVNDTIGGAIAVWLCKRFDR